MEEKERYELFGEFGIIHDTSPNAECMLLNKFQTCEILNGQDKKIQQLKQQLAESEEKCKKAYKDGLLQKQFDKDMEIEPYIKELATYKRALELACREIVYDCGSWKLTIEDEMQDYLDQAKKELEEQK